jgi:hypothetical protein
VFIISSNTLNIFGVLDFPFKATSCVHLRVSVRARTHDMNRSRVHVCMYLCAFVSVCVCFCVGYVCACARWCDSYFILCLFNVLCMCMHVW